MHLVRGRPHPALSGVVGAYADFAERTSGPRETSEPPGRGVVVIIDLDEGWTVEGERFGSFAGGLYVRPVRVRHDGSSRGVQFDLEPPAVQTMLGVPAGALAGQTVELDDLLGADAHRLAERLHAAAGPSERFAVLDEVLLRRLARAPAPARPDVQRAWELMRATDGRIGVDALARTLGCSRRHLARRFGIDVGVSPKSAGRLIRFEATRARLGSAPLARLAAELGFSDQAHLSREFRALAGAPPTAVPFVQDERDRAA